MTHITKMAQNFAKTEANYTVRKHLPRTVGRFISAGEATGPCNFRAMTSCSKDVDSEAWAVKT